jgi:hypothetical protein
MLHILVKIDNVGAIYLSNNFSLGQITKHNDIRRHFVREFTEEGILKTVFVRTADNSADIYIKNTPEDIFESHIKWNLQDVRTIHLSNRKDVRKA